MKRFDVGGVRGLETSKVEICLVEAKRIRYELDRDALRKARHLREYSHVVYLAGLNRYDFPKNQRRKIKAEGFGLLALEQANGDWRVREEISPEMHQDPPRLNGILKVLHIKKCGSCGRYRVAHAC